MLNDSSYFGPQGFGDDDRREGSRFAEVKKALFANAYYLVWGAVGEPPLPIYEVTLGRVLRGLMPGGLPWLFKQAAQRAVDSYADCRWGPDGRGFRRLLHPNGIALFGKWIIDQPSPYSGYFRTGSQALIIGRYSTCCTETRRGFRRSLSLVGKLYPTTDPLHAEPLRTGNFITQEDIGGARTDYINDAELLNAPPVTPWRRGWGTPILLITGVLFKLVNREPAIRQLHTIAELGKPDTEPTRAPKFMRLTVDPTQVRIEGQALDFRDEILAQLYLRGNLQSKGCRLIFNIEVTDDGQRYGLIAQRHVFANWKKIGRIEFDEAVASYNTDFVLHFNHPTWRTDTNDPNTATRQPRKSNPPIRLE